MYWLCDGSRKSAVSIVTGYELDDRGIGVRVPVNIGDMYENTH
jgi:hypothetical protein